MLTQEQKDKLEPLTKHSKFGKLLVEAMKAWEIAAPAKGNFGLDKLWLDSKFEFNSLKNPSCCLIGALLFKKTSNSYSLCLSAQYIFKLDHDDVNFLVAGFDCSNSFISEKSEAYLFGNQVSNILFP